MNAERLKGITVDRVAASAEDPVPPDRHRDRSIPVLAVTGVATAITAVILFGGHASPPEPPKEARKPPIKPINRPENCLRTVEDD